MAQKYNTSYSLIDKALIENDGASWDVLLEYYKRFVIFILRDLNVDDNDIEDVSQDILLSLSKSLKNYDREKGNFRSWLRILIKNSAYMHFRKRKTEHKYVDSFYELAENDATVESDIDERITNEWETYLITSAMEQIRDNFSENSIRVFQLSLDGMPAPKIAETTQLTIQSVYTLKKRMKNAFLQEIQSLKRDLEF